MEYKFNKKNRFIAAIITLAFISSNFLPFFVPKAEAFLGIGDVTFTINVKEIVRNIIDGIAMSMAQKMVDDMVQSSVQWANTGFEGSPSFITNPEDHFLRIANGVAGDFIKGSDLGFLCSPFQTSIRLSLQAQYGGTSRTYTPQCTVTGIKGNLEDFYGDFATGGWDTWFSVLQNDSNNPYGAYLEAQVELDKRLAAKLNIEDKQLSWGQGFKGKADCETYNPSQEEINQLIADYPGKTPPGYNPAYPPGACTKYKEIKTPGTVIKGQLDKVLPAGLEKLISVQHVEQLISAFANGLLKRYVFSSKGLAGNDYSGEVAEREALDLDGDTIPEGYDDDRDGELDSCLHGLIDNAKPVSNTNCTYSTKAVNSPYYIPICQATENTINTLSDFRDFVDRNTFKKEYVNTWMNRTLLAGDSVDRLEGTISRYEVMEYDPVIFRLGKYTKYTGKLVQSMAKDEDLKDRGFIDWDFGGGTRSDSAEQDVLLKNTRNLLDYLKRFRNAIGKCDNPDTKAISNLTPPTIDDGPGVVPPPGWTFCAVEGDFCVFSGTRNVLYGVASASITSSFTDGVACTNEAFGMDPAPDIEKLCLVEIETTATPVDPGTGPNIPGDGTGVVEPI